MVMVLMVGIAQSIVTTYYNQMSIGIQVSEIATIMVVAVILLLLIHRMPGLISGVITGATIGHSGIGAFSAGAGVGAASIAAATAATAGAVTSEGAKNVSGGGQALKAAFQSAQQNMATTREANSNASSASYGGLGAAMGTGKSFVADMGKSLAKAAGTTLKESLGSGTNESFLGRVAGNIKSEMSNSAGNQSSKASMPNAIGTMNISNAKSEIDAFVNKNLN
jgi:type IV secretory pathway TrbL component